MYIKKPVLIVCAVVLAVAVAFLSVAAVNPFGFTHLGDFVKFAYVSRLVESQYYQDVDSGDYANTALEGVAAATGDPYTRYLWGDSAKAYMESIDGNYMGIGIYIENNTEENTIDVVSAIAGSPAEEAGLVTGDKILAVNGTAYSGEQMNDAVNEMRGEEGTEVTVTVLRKSSGESEDIKLVRREIDIPNVSEKMITDDIGCITITQFTSGVSAKFASSYSKLLGEGMKRLVIDLRNNPGGLVEEAAAIANMFIDDGNVIVYTMDKKGKRVDYPATGNAADIPIAILANRGSASASEILTGALKDYGKGYLIGEKTYGKGIVQSVYDLGEDSLLSVTVARYYTPNGVCIHGEGIEPDETIKMDTEKYARLTELPSEQDEQLQAAIKYLSK